MWERVKRGRLLQLLLLLLLLMHLFSRALPFAEAGGSHALGKTELWTVSCCMTSLCFAAGCALSHRASSKRQPARVLKRLLSFSVCSWLCMLVAVGRGGGSCCFCVASALLLRCKLCFDDDTAEVHPGLGFSCFFSSVPVLSRSKRDRD
ncbi:hypothetical protein sr17262 [Sporisorium reilianum SRZ2]|uniref:Uncharacterized protein n=1 Tax=Sporisorium reilianum (strain SRZ2) TaxID=999809 RepID=E6ZYG2_SPORE|nr:hypothetical protein sr17262 [Sporisorium reilianum SRZ2]